MNPVDGIVDRPSRWSVAATVDRLVAAIEGAGAKVFAIIDHSGEADKVGLSLRDTKLLVFGNPAEGTPLMQEVPTIALDLPLKILVWEDAESKVWMTCLSGEWLSNRYAISGNLAKVLAAAEGLTDNVMGESD